MTEEKRFHHTVASNGTYIGVRINSSISHPTFDRLFEMLRERGWNIQTDPDTLKNFPIIAKDYFHGKKGDLFFKSHRYQTGFELEFYQEVNTVNPNGGRYDFGKLKLMPYLIRCRFLVELGHIKSFLLNEGYADHSEPVLKNAAEEVEHRIKSSCHYEEGKADKQPDYNAKDKDGKRLRDGQVKYFRDRKGRLQRGTVFHNINNMWWVIINKFEFRNKACFEFFDLDTEENRVRKYIEPSGHHNPKSRKIPTPEQFEVWCRQVKKGGVIQRIEYANDFLAYLYKIDWMTHKYEFFIKDNGRLGLLEIENKVWGNHKVFDKPQQIKLYSKRLPMSSTESSWIVALRTYVTSGKPSLSSWFCTDRNGEGRTAYKWPNVREKAWKMAALAI